MPRLRCCPLRKQQDARNYEREESRRRRIAAKCQTTFEDGLIQKIAHDSSKGSGKNESRPEK